jgi:hypothetical protein
MAPANVEPSIHNHRQIQLLDSARQQIRRSDAIFTRMPGSFEIINANGRTALFQ